MAHKLGSRAVLVDLVARKRGRGTNHLPKSPTPCGKGWYFWVEIGQDGRAIMSRMAGVN
jgi:hypothetical protein